MAGKVIENVPRVAQFLKGGSMLTPYVGSLWAALSGMGRPRPYADLLALSGAGYQKFADPAIRRILAEEGRRAMALDQKAVEAFARLVR